MSTAFTQLIHSISTPLVLLCTLGCIACAVYVARAAVGVKRLKSLGLDVSELYERQEALQERFTSFQKRENMRATRREKTSSDDLKREAAAILEQAQGGAGTPGQSAGGPVASKADLYRRARH
jgi:hypothetical protein